MSFYGKVLYFLYGSTLYSTYTFAFIFLEKYWSFPLYAYNYLSILFLLCPLINTAISMHIDKHPKKLSAFIILSTLGFSVFFILLFVIPPNSIKYKMATVITLYGISNLFGSIIGPLLDTLVLSFPVTDSNKFGQDRLWTSVAHSFITIVIGYLHDTFIDYWSILICLAISSMAFIIALLIQPLIQNTEKMKIIQKLKENENEKIENMHEKIENMHEKIEILNNANGIKMKSESNNGKSNLIILCIVILIGGINRCMVGNLLPYYLTSKIKLSFLMTAIALHTRIIPEILLFFHAYRITPLFQNDTLERNLQSQLSLGIFFGFLRSALYCLSNRRWLSFGVELLKGCNHALIRDAISRLAKIKSHDKNSLGAFTQTITSLMYGDVAQAISGTIGGLLLQFPHGKEVQFQISLAFGIVTFMCLIAFLLIEFLKRRNNVKSDYDEKVIEASWIK